MVKFPARIALTTASTHMLMTAIVTMMKRRASVSCEVVPGTPRASLFSTYPIERISNLMSRRHISDSELSPARCLKVQCKPLPLDRLMVCFCLFECNPFTALKIPTEKKKELGWLNPAINRPNQRRARWRITADELWAYVGLQAHYPKERVTL